MALCRDTRPWPDMALSSEGRCCCCLLLFPWLIMLTIVTLLWGERELLAALSLPSSMVPMGGGSDVTAAVVTSLPLTASRHTSFFCSRIRAMRERKDLEEGKRRRRLACLRPGRCRRCCQSGRG